MVSSLVLTLSWQVLDVEEGDMAVRLALGETQLIAENREYFRSEGVDIDALYSAPAKQSGGPPNTNTATRSKTVILVKNLPAATQAAELMKLFSVGGEIARVLLPPSR